MSAPSAAAQPTFTSPSERAGPRVGRVREHRRVQVADEDGHRAPAALRVDEREAGTRRWRGRSAGRGTRRPGRSRAAPRGWCCTTSSSDAVGKAPHRERARGTPGRRGRAAAQAAGPGRRSRRTRGGRRGRRPRACPATTSLPSAGSSLHVRRRAARMPSMGEIEYGILPRRAERPGRLQAAEVQRLGSAPLRRFSRSRRQASDSAACRAQRAAAAAARRAGRAARVREARLALACRARACPRRWREGSAGSGRTGRSPGSPSRSVSKPPCSVQRRTRGGRAGRPRRWPRRRLISSPASKYGRPEPRPQVRPRPVPAVRRRRAAPGGGARRVGIGERVRRAARRRDRGRPRARRSRATP